MTEQNEAPAPPEQIRPETSRLVFFPLVGTVLLALLSLLVLPRRPPIELMGVVAAGCLLLPAMFTLVLHGLRPLLVFLFVSGTLLALAAWSLFATDRVWVAAAAVSLLGCLVAYGLHRATDQLVGSPRGETT